MPYKKRGYSKRYRKRGTKTGAPLTRNKWTRSKRVGQNLTRDVRWFKSVRTITSNDNGNFRQIYQPGDITDCFDWAKWASIWEEYKVLQVVVKFLPSAVGSESLQEAPNPATVPGNQATFKRGNAVTWVDQGELDVPGGLQAIQRIIVRPSARLISTRRYHKRYINRPNGNPSWGRLDPDGTIAINDEWVDSRIQIFGENFTPLSAAGGQNWYYVMIAFKVIFRGRQDLPDPGILPVPTP